MTHHSKVDATAYQKIASGQRQIEPRLNDDNHKRIRLGDLIVFANRQTGAEVVAKVVGVLRFERFNQLFAAFPLSYFAAESLDGLKAEVAQWYTPASEVRHGVLGIKLHVLQSKKGGHHGN